MMGAPSSVLEGGAFDLAFFLPLLSQGGTVQPAPCPDLPPYNNSCFPTSNLYHPTSKITVQPSISPVPCIILDQSLITCYPSPVFADQNSRRPTFPSPLSHTPRRNVQILLSPNPFRINTYKATSQLLILNHLREQLSFLDATLTQKPGEGGYFSLRPMAIVGRGGKANCRGAAMLSLRGNGRVRR